MKRRVLVYRAEPAAAGILNGGRPSGPVTPPSERRPLDTFTIYEVSVDKAREIARDVAARRNGGDTASAVHVLIDGSISVTLPPPRS